MQAITTTYLPATNTRGARIKAQAWAGSVIIAYDHALNAEDAHAEAARALCEKLGWAGQYVGGGSHDCRGWHWINTASYESFSVATR